MAPGNTPKSRSKVAGKMRDWWEGGREFLEDVGWVKPKPLPKCHKNNKHYENIPTHKDNDGNVFYEVTEEWLGQDVDGDGKKDSVVDVWEGYFKQWYYEDQIKEYSKDIQLIEQEIQDYETEIREIDKYIAEKKRKNLKAEMNTAELLDKIKSTNEDIAIRLNGGATETDADIQALRKDIEHYEKQLKKYKVEDKYNVANWRIDPYSSKKEERDLYSLRLAHRNHIRHLRKYDLKYRKKQLFLSAWHLRRLRRWIRKNYY